MDNIDNTLADSMTSEDFEIYCVEDIVDEAVTQYHSHDFYEIHITLSGHGIFYLDGAYQKISSGTILLINHGDLHRICAQKSDYYERIFIYITPEYLKKRSSKLSNLAQCFEPIGNTKSKILNIDIAEIIDFLRVFSQQKETKTYGDDLVFEQTLLSFLIYVNKRVINDEFEVIGGKKSSNQLIDDVMAYVNSNLGEDLSLDAVSKRFFISKFHLSHKFKEIMDMTFHNYVLKKRLNYSKQLLRKSKISSEIYIECGFTSYSYFLKSFKKEYGITPKEFIAKTNSSENMYFNDRSYR